MVNCVISKFTDAEQYNYILKLFHVTLYVFKAFWKFKSFIKDTHKEETPSNKTEALTNSMNMYIWAI